jgi:hypothetical protein
VLRNWKVALTLLAAGVILLAAGTGCDLQNLPFALP